MQSQEKDFEVVIVDDFSSAEHNIDNINIGDEINVIVCGKKFTWYDKMISIIGRIIKDKIDDDISVIEEVEDDSPSIDDEEEDKEGFGRKHQPISIVYARSCPAYHALATL
jgi:hypothetical protein